MKPVATHPFLLTFALLVSQEAEAFFTSRSHVRSTRNDWLASSASDSNSDASIGIRILDEEATLAQSRFPIEPPALIRRCQEVIAGNLGTDEPEKFLSPSFEFVGPFDGPLNRAQYAKSTGDILTTIKSAFPDVTTNYYNFHVDPFEPNRVWYNTRATATMTEPLNLAGSVFEPNGERIEQAPQTASMTFDEDGKVTELTAGFVIDRRYGNTMGLSSVYAVFRHVGLELPFPEGRPWQPSAPLKLFQEFNTLAAKVSSLFAKDNEENEQMIYWWRKECADRLHSKRENTFAVPPVNKDI